MGTLIIAARTGKLLSMNRLYPPLILACLLLLLPALAYLERAQTELWQNRLVWAEFFPEPGRHTPRFHSGTYLPASIGEDVTISAKDNPILLSGSTTITPAGSLTLESGVRVYASEYAHIVVKGTLNSQGSKTSPVIFTTNEQHRLNQVWNGIIFKENSRGTITYTHFIHAAPAISCLKNSNAVISNALMRFGNNGIYTESSGCAIQNSSLLHMHTGIISIGSEAQETGNHIGATHMPIRIIGR